MPIKPTIRDDNGLALPGHGSEIYTKRYAAVGTTGQAISLPVDVKSVRIHVEGSTEVARFVGTVAGSEEVRITSDGTTLNDVPIVKRADEDIMTVKAPSATIDVSVFAWR